MRHHPQSEGSHWRHRPPHAARSGRYTHPHGYPLDHEHLVGHCLHIVERCVGFCLEPRGNIEPPRPRRRSHGCGLAFCCCTRHICRLKNRANTNDTRSANLYGWFSTRRLTELHSLGATPLLAPAYNFLSKFQYFFGRHKSMLFQLFCPSHAPIFGRRFCNFFAYPAYLMQVLIKIINDKFQTIPTKSFLSRALKAK